MCRAIGDKNCSGGRRCPGDHPVARRARQRASYAVTKVRTAHAAGRQEAAAQAAVLVDRMDDDTKAVFDRMVADLDLPSPPQPDAVQVESAVPALPATAPEWLAARHADVVAERQKVQELLAMAVEDPQRFLAEVGPYDAEQIKTEAAFLREALTELHKYRRRGDEDFERSLDYVDRTDEIEMRSTLLGHRMRLEAETRAGFTEAQMEADWRARVEAARVEEHALRAAFETEVEKIKADIEANRETLRGEFEAAKASREALAAQLYDEIGPAPAYHEDPRYKAALAAENTARDKLSYYNDPRYKPAYEPWAESCGRLRTLESGTGDDIKAQEQRLAEATLSVVSEVRSLGGELAVSDLSDKKSAAILREAVQVYPTDWIEASNRHAERQSFVIRATKARAHYRSLGEAGGKKRVQRTTTTWKPMDWEPPAGDPAYDGWEKGGTTSRTSFVDGEYRSEEVQVWRQPYWDNEPGERDRKPRGAGWKWVESDGKTGPVTGDYIGQCGGYWRRPHTKLVNAGVTGSELLVSPRTTSVGVAGRGNGVPVAVHEFAHRAQHVVTHMKRMDDAFHRRRTAGEPLVRMRGRGANAEVAREDHFADIYMGREYPDNGWALHDQSTGIHPEALAVGAESVFAGSYHGMTGVGRSLTSKSDVKSNGPDSDSRAYVLGMWATA